MMKIKIIKRLTIVLIAILSFSCQEEDPISTVIEYDAPEMKYNVVGGEKSIIIKSTNEWNFSNDEDWITIRRNQNTLRVIVESNNTENERTSQITIMSMDGTKIIIELVQDGVLITPNVGVLNIENKQSVSELKIVSNCAWTVTTNEEWCKAVKNNDGVSVTADPSYSLSPRECEMRIFYGDVTKTVKIIQKNGEWYETFDMSFVQGGSFWMGAQSSNSSSANYDPLAFIEESPVHKVTVSDFYLCKFEVTQAQWLAAMGNNPSQNIDINSPVEMVTWEDTQEFIDNLNQLTGKKYRLPTEAEWEYAARGGIYNSGNIFSGNNILNSYGWYYSNSESIIHNIGKKLPNELGIYDMSGNVREWCCDWYGAYTMVEETNPIGSEIGMLKTNRGGGWASPSDNCRNSYRQADTPDTKAKDLGFRLVCEIN